MSVELAPLQVHKSLDGIRLLGRFPATATISLALMAANFDPGVVRMHENNVMELNLLNARAFYRVLSRDGWRNLITIELLYAEPAECGPE